MSEVLVNSHLHIMLCPRNWMAKSITGYLPHPRVCTAPAPCSSYPTPLVELGFDGWGLVTPEVHQSPISTPLNTHRYLVQAGLIGGGLRAVRNPDQCPYLITGHRSIKCPGSPQRQQAGPDFPAALVAGSGSRFWRGESEGPDSGSAVGPVGPAPLGQDLKPPDSGAGPPLSGVGLVEEEDSPVT